MGLGASWEPKRQASYEPEGHKSGGTGVRAWWAVAWVTAIAVGFAVYAVSEAAVNSYELSRAEGIVWAVGAFAFAAALLGLTLRVFHSRVARQLAEQPEAREGRAGA